MNNHELIAKLSKLRQISPKQTWLENNRALLLSQISNSGAADLPAWRTFLINISSLTQAASRPLVALGTFVILLVGGGLFSHQLFAQAKPNDSLYIARIISERVKVNTTLNPESRSKLELKFAAEHAQDISVILADPEFNTEANSAKVAELNVNFQKEVETVKDRISRLAVLEPAANDSASQTPDVIMIADSSKDEQGIQLEMNTQTAIEVTGAASSSVPAGASSTMAADIAVEANAKIEGRASQKAAVAEKLEEAKQLFEQKDYSKAAEKLREVDELIKK